MSRIGKLPVEIPSGVKASVDGGQVLVEGPKGKLTHGLRSGVSVEIKDGKVLVSMTGTDLQTRANYGMTRATINNMVKGVSKGWKRSLELNGVGFNAKVQGKILVMSCGYSHDVNLTIPPSVTCNVGKNTIDLESPDKDVVGNFASSIRAVHPPEPYLGKGVKYTEETIRRKAGKTGKK